MQTHFTVGPHKYQSIADLILQQSQTSPEATFLIFPEKNVTWLYKDLAQQVASCIKTLQAHQVQHQDKVALLLPNIPEFIGFYWGLMCMGAVANPINTLLTAPEINYIINHCHAKVLVTTETFLPLIEQIADQLPQLKNIIVVRDLPSEVKTTVEATLALNQIQVTNYQIDFSAQLSQVLSNCHGPCLDDEAMMIYTSGTTGKPKGVVLSHNNLITDAMYITQWFGFSSETRLMCILPLFHVNGEVVTLMTPLYCGGSVVLNRKFSASNFWLYIHQYHVNVFSTVPTILSVLIDCGPRDKAFNVSQLQFGICGAAPLPTEVQKQFEKLFNIPIIEGYGLSETTCYSTFNPADLGQRKIGSIGVAVGNQVAIWNEDNQPVGPNQEGEIVIKGPNVMKYYFENPEATAKAFEGGWFHTGDWGMQDTDGFFYILDRVKDIIIRGGENISPREVDEVLYTHPSVAAAATIGIKDDKYGERVKSFVVLKPNTSATEVELITYCQQHLALFKCPEFIGFIDDIPKGPTGKLLRRELRAMHESQK